MKKRRLSNQNITTIMVALIGMVGTVIAAYFAFRGSSAAVELSIRSTREAGAGPSSLPEPLPGEITFASPNDPAALSADLLWEAGSSGRSSYGVSPGSITLTAGPHTWPNFPAVYYRLPFKGNFQAQVRLTFASPVPKVSTAQMAGLVILPLNARLVTEDSSFPTGWAVASKYLTAEGTLVGCRGAWEDYSSESVYLRIEREADTWRCAYSENGENWTRSAMDLEAASLNGRELEMGLFAYSDTGDEITVGFSDWSLTRK